MSRKLAVILLVMLVLTGAMGLKAIVATHANGAVMMANGAGPVPPSPFKNGAGPVPPSPFKNGAGPVPPSPF
jgi:hypothetical protein